MKTKFSEFYNQYGRLSTEFYGKGEITYEDSQKHSCNFGVVQLTNGKTYFAIDLLVQFKDVDRIFNFRGVAESGSIVTLQSKDVQLFIYGSISSTVLQVFLIHRFKIETGNKNPIKRMNFGLTNFLFTGNTSQDSLLLNLRDLPPISILRLSDYNDIIKRLKDKTSVEVTSELLISLNKSEKIDDIINISNEICFLLSICRGSKIFWIYYTCYDEHGGIVCQFYCNSVTHPLSELPELISSEFDGINLTRIFLENAHMTVSENSLLMKYLIKFSNVFVEAREGKGYTESRGVRIVVLMEMLTKYVLEDPRFEMAESILDPLTQKDIKKEIIKKCSEVITVQVQDSDKIRSSNRWNLPTSDAIEAQNKVLENRSDLINNVYGINHAPFRKLVVRLCEKINLEVTIEEIKWFVGSRNTLIHTGKFYSETKGDHATFEEYIFLVNFLDKIFLKLFNYSGRYNNFRKWGSSLGDTI